MSTRSVADAPSKQATQRVAKAGVLPPELAAEAVTTPVLTNGVWGQGNAPVYRLALKQAQSKRRAIQRRRAQSRKERKKRLLFGFLLCGLCDFARDAFFASSISSECVSIGEIG